MKIKSKSTLICPNCEYKFANIWAWVHADEYLTANVVDELNREYTCKKCKSVFRGRAEINYTFFSETIKKDNGCK